MAGISAPFWYRKVVWLTDYLWRLANDHLAEGWGFPAGQPAKNEQNLPYGFGDTPIAIAWQPESD